ncbi:hypothetical protein [Streptomyces chattanoogensis]|uniref:hypothetical protein n=1 Tax=Streptomyces chattanoogensis TaxID=66876 RepID=UPI0036C355CF
MPSPRHPNKPLRALLAEARWTQGSLARAVNIVAAEVGLELDYDRTAVAHWLSGTRPHPPVPELVAEALTRRLERPVTASVAGFAGAADPAAPAQAQPYRPGDLLKACRGVPERQLGPPGAPDGDTGTETALLRSAVHFYSACFNAHGGGTARSALAAYLADDVLPRLRTSQPEPEHRTLLVEASRLSFLLARMYEDSGDHGLAQRHFLTALSLADDSGDRVARAVVLRGLSAQGLALGHHRASLRAAEAAAEAARGEAGPAGTFLLAQLAVAQAACGLRREALGSLARAERAMAADGPGRSPSGPFDTYSQAALEYQSAETLGKAGDTAGAHAAINRSLAHRPAEDHRGLALSYARRAEMLVGTGHVEEACASWRAFLGHYPHLTSGAATAAVTRSRTLLIPFRHVPAAAALLNRLSAAASGGKRC